MLHFFKDRASVLSIQYLLKHESSLAITSVWKWSAHLKSNLLRDLTFANAHLTSILRSLCSSSSSNSDLSGLRLLFEDVRTGMTDAIGLLLEDIVVTISESYGERQKRQYRYQFL